MNKKTIQIIGIIAAILSIISAILFILDWKKKKDSETVTAGGGAGGGKTSKIDGDLVMTNGMENATVKELQLTLNARGQRFEGVPLNTDGVYGNKTKTVAENYLLSRLQPIAPVTLNRIKSLAI